MDTTEYTGPSNIGTTRWNPQIEVYYKGASTKPSYRPTMTPDIVGRYVLARDYAYLAADLAEAEAERDKFHQLWKHTCVRLGKNSLRADAAEAALPAVYRLALEDAVNTLRTKQNHLYTTRCDEFVQTRTRDVLEMADMIEASPTPTAAELMARIQTGEGDE